MVKFLQLQDQPFNQELLLLIKTLSIFTCGIGINKNLNEYRTYTKMFDTGCTSSPLFDDSIWDFDKVCFINPTVELEYLNRIKPENIQTCNGISHERIVYLKKPFYVSIEGLNPVEIYYFTVPLEKETLTSLIGMDIISQHTVLLSKFDGKYGIRITELKEENWI